MLTEVILQNPHASGVLRYGADVVCNTDDEIILSNVLVNSKKANRWAKSMPPNDKTLLICGSGPSIKKGAYFIRQMVEDGAVVWGLNNCANWLNQIGIVPDAQVIMDAKPENLRAIGEAKEYLFASQCHPSLFDAVDATLWHSTHGDFKVDEQPGFPAHDEDYCLIGSAVSVGNTALVLAYALGYRNIQLFGYDSSHSEDSHVIPQEWNAGDPLTIRSYNGKDYVCSFTMALQAEAFILRAAVLIREGATITVHGEGLLPDMWNHPMSEQEKYLRMWDIAAYRESAPGEDVAELFLKTFKPTGRVIDFGCGTGRGALKIAQSCDVLLMDFVNNSRDAAAMGLPFIQHDLSKPIPAEGDIGYCTDVMEHIPTRDLDVVVSNIMGAVQACFFQISTVPDVMGAHIGQLLHVSVFPPEWWANKFLSLGYAITWQREDSVSVLFYVTR